ncbi:hypothetical protein F5984_05890 [Rudanella paleaurantiibacter]|uniref:Uncharacterized protein n=1 Tax=Rudanella paleaurantiibacter TaxID=2614655 RepID=A0A7J5U240_9BACT|nr:hypothetical protein [Rudanella paleaurantiibacter]KAB7731756.1 hypothetical protein F5984_05890 [Rudanella paleaurantiibacter]
MQFSVRALPFVCLFILSGCLVKQVKPRPPSAYSAQYWGNVSGMRNGRALQNPRIWATSRTPCNDHAFDVFITEFNDQGDELLTFTLANIPKRACTLSRFKTDYANLFCATDTVGSTLTAKMSVGFSSTYKPGRWGNGLTIVSYDSLKGEIKGRFRLSLVVDSRLSGHSPDSIRIEQGEFVTKLRGAGGTYR